MKHTPWYISEEGKADLQYLVGSARGRCSEGADVSINHAGFYPRLPPEYSDLVPRYMQVARDAGATVYDGKAFLPRAKLRDHMHFAVDSTEAVVDMYFDAIRQVLSSARDGADAARPPPRVLRGSYVFDIF